MSRLYKDGLRLKLVLNKRERKTLTHIRDHSSKKKSLVGNFMNPPQLSALILPNKLWLFEIHEWVLFRFSPTT